MCVDSYPETLFRHFFINAPMIFVAIFKVIKSWLDPNVAAKMHVLGADYAKTLLQFIDADQVTLS